MNADQGIMFFEYKLGLDFLTLCHHRLRLVATSKLEVQHPILLGKAIQARMHPRLQLRTDFAAKHEGANKFGKNSATALMRSSDDVSTE